MSTNLLYTKLAADLLRELENTQDDERVGEDNYQRLIDVVLQSFYAVEQVTLGKLHENKSGDTSESLEDVGEIG